MQFSRQGSNCIRTNYIKLNGVYIVLVLIMVAHYVWIITQIKRYKKTQSMKHLTFGKPYYELVLVKQNETFGLD